MGDEKSPRPYIMEIVISDIEKKRKEKEKYYVYVMSVYWSDGKKNVICRRYNSFFNLQTALIDAFPVESGVNNPKQRVLPFIPGKILFGRSQVREVALKRKQHLNDYVQELIKLPDNISRCDLILDFFEATKEDIDNLLGGAPAKKKSVKTADNISDPVLLEQYLVVANFKKTERNQISLAAGDTVDVIEKHENGWWFVCLEDEQGWVPSSYLDPIDGDDDEETVTEVLTDEKYICVREYKASLPDELTIDFGDVVHVVKKCRDGWWEVRLRHLEAQAAQGFVPYAHLKKVPKKAEEGLSLKIKPSPKERGFVVPPRKKTIKRKATIPSQPKITPRTVSSTEAEVAEKAVPVAARRPPADTKDNVKPTQEATQKPEEEPNADFEEEVIYVAIGDIKTEDNFKVEAGERMQIIEKSPNGWWYVKVGNEEGWVPSTYAQRKRRQLKRKEKEETSRMPPPKDVCPPKVVYQAVEDYLAGTPECISFACGAKIEVLEKSDEGWWYVIVNGKEGWAPSTYLKEITVRPPLQKPVMKPEDSQRYIPPSNVSSDSDDAAPQHKPRPRKTPSMPSKDSDSSDDKENNDKPNLPPRVSSKQDSDPLFQVVNKKESRSKGDRNNNTKGRRERFIAVADYKSSDEGMLSFTKGETLKIIQKDEGGWWLASSINGNGWVPSNFLKPKT